MCFHAALCEHGVAAAGNLYSVHWCNDDRADNSAKAFLEFLAATSVMRFNAFAVAADQSVCPQDFEMPFATPLFIASISRCRYFDACR